MRVYLELFFSHNGKNSILKIGNKSNYNLHKFKITNISNNNNYEIINNTKNWLANFKILKNTKEINKAKKTIVNKDSREEVLQKIYSKLEYYFLSKNVATNKSLTYKTFKLLEHISKKLK